MKFVLFCEGETEAKVLPGFLKRWLDPRLDQGVGISPVKFDGWSDLARSAAKKARQRLRERDVIAVISLLDLYGPSFYPPTAKTVQERVRYGTEHMQGKVGSPRFHQFFAVHELEAWLLSDPALFCAEVQEALGALPSTPETINSMQPPAKRLGAIYPKCMGRGYRKVADGVALFSKLNPNLAASKCPHLNALLDCLVALAVAAGVPPRAGAGE